MQKPAAAADALEAVRRVLVAERLTQILEGGGGRHVGYGRQEAHEDGIRGCVVGAQHVRPHQTYRPVVADQHVGFQGAAVAEVEFEIVRG